MKLERVYIDLYSLSAGKNVNFKESHIRKFLNLFAFKNKILQIFEFGLKKINKTFLHDLIYKMVHPTNI